MKYQIPPYSVAEHTAWAKAPADVHEIAAREGFADFPVNPCPIRGTNLFWRLVAAAQWQVEMRRVEHRLRDGDVVLIQGEPGFFCRRSGRDFFARLVRRGIRFVLVVHDIDALRTEEGPERQTKRDEFIWLAKRCARVIVHNAKMKAWCVENGLAEVQLIVLGIFDYLMPTDSGAVSGGADGCRIGDKGVIIAGNLKADKAGYLAKLKLVEDVEWNLYGPYFDAEKIGGKNVHHLGCFPPEELPQKLQGRFGLVWDGPEIESCEGPNGTYLRYNNPHKLSLFLASRIPVIIWSDAAEADFVRTNKVGVCVRSLRDIPAALKCVDTGAYETLRSAVVNLSGRLRGGSFMQTALRGCS